MCLKVNLVKNPVDPICWELRNIYHHHHPESKKRKNLQRKNSGFIHPYGRYENAVKTRKTISTIAILWPVKAIFENRAATVEVDSFVSPDLRTTPFARWRQKGQESQKKDPAYQILPYSIRFSMQKFLAILPAPMNLQSEELKKAVAVSEEKSPAAFPQARPMFQQPFSLRRKVPKPWQG